MKRVLLNLALYQLAWFGCVLGASVRQPAWGYGAVAVAVLWHLGRAAKPLREGLLLLAVLVVGAVFEVLLLQSGWVRMAPELLVAGVLPAWMVGLWAAFGTTFNIALRALRDRGVLVAFLGLIGAPLAYAAGAGLGAFEFNDAPLAMSAVAAGWALLMPLLLGAARRFDGYATA